MMDKHIFSSSNSSMSFVQRTPTNSSGGSQKGTMVPLTISQGGSNINLVVPEQESFELEKLRDEFESEESLLDDEEDAPISTPERVCLRFVTLVMHGASRQSTVAAALCAFEDRFLRNSDIHTIAGQPPATMSEEKEFLKTYYSICDYCGRSPRATSSALLEAGVSGEARIFAAFGGQGAINPICLQELRELNRIYEPLLAELVDEISTQLEDLSSTSDVASVFGSYPILVRQWLEGAITPPDVDELATAPYSFPLVGLLGLSHYVVACKAANLTPGQMRSRLAGVTGHSQGIAVAAVVAVADTWDQFYKAANTVMEMLFWLGYYSQKSAPESPLSAKLITDSVDNGEGEPANLLSVRGLQRKQIDALVATVNKSLRDDEEVFVALRNTSSNFVLAGPAHSLYGVNKHLRTMKASEGEIQSRLPFDKRKPIVYHSFLPVSAPFHTPYLKSAAAQVKAAMSSTVIKPSALALPVFETMKAEDLQKSLCENVLHKLVDNICTEFADWPAVLKCPDATHIVSFDAGGIGNLIIQIKDGFGVRTIFGSDFGRSDDRAGRKTDLFSPSFAALSSQPQSWLERFAPRIEKSSEGKEQVGTKLTRLLGLPHVTVAAMTPTTVPWDMCSAVMNAGYHIELAGGGYYNDANMTDAIKSLVNSIPVGRGITCNIIYSSPHAVSWQIPMLRRLVREGVPIDGLSIGAGVPSPEVTEEYITTLGLRHLTLKPGSHSAIRDTIAVAAAHPTFPVILQWTGGRGGGHHSYEDFHDPILDLYAEIRKQENLILVAGSGFGGAEDTYSYLTGTWSTEHYGRAAMPFDGILMGSRMMVAKEAHTSPQAKALICSCPGTDAEDWTGSYERPVGGIMTVKSEMGQPIHKVATRGVMFWAEMDKIFALPRDKMTKEVQSKKSYIVRRLNSDFAKPYFGKNTAGQPVDVSEMTYAEIISRMIDLMYVRHQSRWINKTYETFVCNMVKRTIERLGGSQRASVSGISDPLVFYKTLLDCIPAAATTIVDPDDESYFLTHCKKRGQKPVNFVPVIDESLETWMKKDSLWQSEDVDAVIDQDVQRVCILQGPVAARFSNSTEETAKDILDAICSKHTQMLKKDIKETIKQATDYDTFGQTSPAIQALCSEEFVLNGSSRLANPLRRVLQLPTASSTFQDDGKKLIISVTAGVGKDDDTIEVETSDDRYISVRLVYVKPGSTEGATLELGYIWHAERPFYQIEQSSDQKNSQIRDFYRKLWLQDNRGLSGASNYFEATHITLSQDTADKVNKAVKMADAAHLKSSMPTDLFPIDGLIMVSWNIVVKPLLIDTLDGDLLALVHLSNKAEYLPGTEPFKIGDVISGTSQISSLSIGKPGKTLEVRAELCKDGIPVAVVTSAFLFRGTYKDFHQTFRDVHEPERTMKISTKLEEAVLKNRDWFKLNSKTDSLVGKTLVFDLRTSCTWETADTFDNLSTKGTVFEKINEEQLSSIGQVSFEATKCSGNPVIDFLERKGGLTEKVVKLKQPGWDGDAFYEVQVPATNEAYSVVSNDCNPIHTAPAFAAWADLPGTITHGMYTSAIVRSMLESIVADGDRKRFRSFSSRFTGMVMPNDILQVQLSHVAMLEGSKVFDIKVVKEEGGDQVLEGQAIVEEVPTTFIFTGQGSQSKGMGMDLYESSPVAKKLWDDTDKFLLNTYGWSILQVVRENPKSLTVYFGGKRGREIRKNYLALTIQTIRPDGTAVTEPILKSLTPSSMSYTFSEPRGLLFSTQFAQPAITLVSKAAFLDMRSKGLVAPGSTFAGHSLGEYGALSAFTDFIPFQTLMSVVFYRGLTMQVAMDRDEHGSTDFSMVAVNPGRVGKWFDEASLRQVLSSIATRTDGLMEIVNFNVKGEQYVAAGHLRNIYALGGVMDHLFGNPEASKLVKDFVAADDSTRYSTALGKVVDGEIAKAQSLKKPFELKRGKATIPLQGIDVPFHSTYLRPSVPAYRSYLEQKLQVQNIVPERFLNKFIPNVMAKPFKLDSEYFSEAADLTGSSILRRVAETGMVSA